MPPLTHSLLSSEDIPAKAEISPIPQQATRELASGREGGGKDGRRPLAHTKNARSAIQQRRYHATRRNATSVLKEGFGRLDNRSVYTERMVTPTTHEQTLNVALGEVLALLRRSWNTRTEETGNVLSEGGRPDILIEEASGWPVVIEAERSDHTSAENDAKNRLGKTVATTGRQIETAIALVYPPILLTLDGPDLRDAIEDAQGLEYALYTHRLGEPPERLPSSGWMRGNVRDLAILVHRAAVPSPRIEALAADLGNGVRVAAEHFTRRHPLGSETGAHIAAVLGQADDRNLQTREMAMTVVANALIFHESLAEVEFQIPETESGHTRAVKRVQAFRSGGIFLPDDLSQEWERILSVNYWPIFWSAREILSEMPTATAHDVLDWLWRTGQKLVAGGVTQSHDLIGIVFQRLIKDRSYLAANYTRPEAAAFLAGLALPEMRLPPGGADWGDGDTLASIQIGDFACGSGTLLSTSYQRLSLLHELHGGDPRTLHGPMMRHGLIGLDVLNIAVHFTAAMLAGSHPDTPFDGECLLTMPYGEQEKGVGDDFRDMAVAVGSLDLLEEPVQRGLMNSAVAVSSGGRAPTEVRDLVSRVGHGKFDLVIMNPPFVRPTNHEGQHADVPIPSFAAFETTLEQQQAMSDRVRQLTKGAPSNGYAGMSSEFVELAHRKVREGGMVAMVLPLSAISGISWDGIRARWRDEYDDIIVVTVAGAGSYDSSFSAETGMAECLFVARRVHDVSKGNRVSAQKRATYVVLNEQVRSAANGELLAMEIRRLIDDERVSALEDSDAVSRLRLGEEDFGVIIDAPIPENGPWPLAGISDGELAKLAENLGRGALLPLGRPSQPSLDLPITRVGKIARRGPVDRDINGKSADGTPAGPFDIESPPKSAAPTYPVLWAHDTKSERRLIVASDSEGRIRSPFGGVTDDMLRTKSARISATATRAHYNRDLQFNAQSLIVAMTERPCIGGRAWPSVIFENQDHEYAFALWCNSTLGLLMHWWVSNKTQSGRGTTTVTGIPNIPTLDVTKLTDVQVAAAKDAFDAMRDLRFLPFDQIDEDPARAELDRRLLLDVLGLPAWLCDEDGPIDLLRRKLAREPQIHGDKKSRVVFLEPDGEAAHKRADRVG